MNERIEKLKNQAVDYAQEVFEYHGKDYREIVMEKFAELIVMECVDQVWYTREDYINENISDIIKERMKQHFGVE